MIGKTFFDGGGPNNGSPRHRGHITWGSFIWESFVPCLRDHSFDLRREPFEETPLNWWSWVFSDRKFTLSLGVLTVSAFHPPWNFKGESAWGQQSGRTSYERLSECMRKTDFLSPGILAFGYFGLATGAQFALGPWQNEPACDSWGSMPVRTSH